MKLGGWAAERPEQQKTWYPYVVLDVKTKGGRGTTLVRDSCSIGDVAVKFHDGLENSKRHRRRGSVGRTTKVAEYEWGNYCPKPTASPITGFLSVQKIVFLVFSDENLARRVAFRSRGSFRDRGVMAVVWRDLKAAMGRP